MGINT